jgi:hypothetical protein
MAAYAALVGLTGYRLAVTGERGQALGDIFALVYRNLRAVLVNVECYGLLLVLNAPVLSHAHVVILEPIRGGLRSHVVSAGDLCLRPSALELVLTECFDYKGELGVRVILLVDVGVEIDAKAVFDALDV